jgi:hypothetical protein
MVGRARAARSAAAAGAGSSRKAWKKSPAAGATAATERGVGCDNGTVVLHDIAAGDVQAAAGPAAGLATVAGLARSPAVPADSAFAALAALASTRRSRRSGSPVAAGAAEAANPRVSATATRSADRTIARDHSSLVQRERSVPDQVDTTATAPAAQGAGAAIATGVTIAARSAVLARRSEAAESSERAGAAVAADAARTPRRLIALDGARGVEHYVAGAQEQRAAGAVATGAALASVARDIVAVEAGATSAAAGTPRAAEGGVATEDDAAV